MIFTKKNHYCPDCETKLTSKKLGFMEGCLSGCSMEIAFWVVLGFIGSVVTLTQSITILVLFLFLLAVWYILDKFYAKYVCKTCSQEFVKKKGKFVLTKINKQ